MDWEPADRTAACGLASSVVLQDNGPRTWLICSTFGGEYCYQSEDSDAFFFGDGFLISSM